MSDNLFSIKTIDIISDYVDTLDAAAFSPNLPSVNFDCDSTSVWGHRYDVLRITNPYANEARKRRARRVWSKYRRPEVRR